MPVLEVTQLRLKEVAAHDPALLASLSIVRGKLQTKSVFYTCIEDPTHIVILGIWSTLEAHHHFLASPARDEVLGPQEHLLDFISTVHMDLDAMSSLPLDAPVLALERRFIKPDCLDAYNQAVTDDVRLMAQGTIPFNVIIGWRCDASPEHPEALVFTGWPSMEAHAAFAEKTRDHAETSAIRQLYHNPEAWHGRNMERQDHQ
ncbi:hypothetical protein B0J11DRAFT_299172 [Dendryphion nanum]|uniref:ABM domain-containing protein n=1 Tax=Dendryphion nanum TaxID=256645 RepID=A0A9P9IK39_9PLEO|nr:hypothetical protein B0J11DRAFT_299172 [Dendryphion nanum]